MAAAIPLDRIDDGPIVCPFRLVTGLPCPACGTTRVWTYAMHGRFSDAVALNPFALLTLTAAVGLIAWRVASLASTRIAVPQLDRLLRSKLVLAVLGVWIAWWIIGPLT